MIKKLLLFLLIILSISACSPKPNGDAFTCKLSYFERENLNEIVFSEKTLQASTYEDALGELFNLLCHPEDASFVSAIPSGIHLFGASFKDGLCSISLSPAYRTLSPDKRITLNFALAKTILSLPGTDKLSVLCNGSQVALFTDDSFVSAYPRVHHDSYIANLYFVNDDYTDAVSIKKSITLSDEKSLERAVIELLMGESGLDGVRTPFPAGTILNDIYVDGGTCVVDVSSKFITAAKHGKEEETTVIFAIVNTLTELPKIDNVKFLINGIDGYGYTHYDLSVPMTNSEQLFED